MIRTLLATTALTALMSTGAMAQEAAPATDTLAPATTETETQPSLDAEGTAAGSMQADTMGQDNMRQPFEMATGYTAVDTDNLATRLIDQPVYSSAGDDAEEIGNVTDLVFTEDGEIAAVVIGVGGFLGIGEKSVAVDFSMLEFVIATDNTERWVVPTTADDLNNAPDFVWEDDTPADTMTGPDGMATDPAMAPADGMATDGMAADPAMAPADDAMATDPAMAPADDAMATDPAMAPADNMGAAPLPREGYTAMDYEALTADNLTGATVIGPEGDDIAEVGEILLTEDGQIDAMVVDFGGFLGLGQKQVAVALDNLEFAANEYGDIVIYSDFTREQLAAQQDYDEATYASDPAQRATDM